MYHLLLPPSLPNAGLSLEDLASSINCNTVLETLYSLTLISILRPSAQCERCSAYVDLCPLPKCCWILFCKPVVDDPTYKVELAWFVLAHLRSVFSLNALNASKVFEGSPSNSVIT